MVILNALNTRGHFARCCLAVAALVVSGLQLRAQDPPTILLPDDPSAIVFLLDYDYRAAGSWASKLPDGPYLAIRRDGTAIHTNFDGVYRAMLSPLELQNLLHYIINDQRFLDFTEQKVEAAVSAERQRIGVFIFPSHLTSPTIRVRTRDIEHEARFSGPDWYAERHPSVTSLRQFLRIEKRLRRVVDVVVAGGVDDFEMTLELANAYTKTRTDLPQLTADDSTTSSGTRKARLCHSCATLEMPPAPRWLWSTVRVLHRRSARRSRRKHLHWRP